MDPNRSKLLSGVNTNVVTLGPNSGSKSEEYKYQSGSIFALKIIFAVVWSSET